MYSLFRRRLLKNVQSEAQQYVKSQETARTSQEPTRSVQEPTRTSHEPLRTTQRTTVVNLSQQNRTKQTMKESLFPPIRQNEEKVQNNRKIYRSVIVT